MRNWLVSADDRTGALEVAAEIARSAGPVEVTVGTAPEGDGVVDIGSRRLAPADSVARVEALPAARWNAHKMDSTLRGNWAAELRARRVVLGARVLLIAAWPEMGRTCVGGVVHVHGNAIGAIADDLPEADLLVDAGALASWLSGGSGVAVVDVLDAASMQSVAAVVAGHDLLVAGPAGPIGAVFAAWRGVAQVASRFAGRVRCEPPALVVRGSATDVSRDQVERLARSVPGVDVLEAPPATGRLVPAVAMALAGRARARMAATPYRTVVLIGGDTAAAVLGADPRRVGGTVGPGMPWSHDGRGEGPLVVTKAGGFGGPDALVELFNHETV